MGSKDRDANGGRSAIRHSINGGCWYLAGCQHLYGANKCPASKCKGKGYDDAITEANRDHHSPEIPDGEFWYAAAPNLQYVQTCSEQEPTPNGRARMSVRLPRS